MRSRAYWKPFLGLLLGLSLVRGALYSAITPPWQTPDEPKHFEYIRLLYEKRRLVREEDMSPRIQEDILSSMREHDFWKFAGSVSKVSEAEATSFAAMGWATELDRPPLYYLLHVPFYAIISQQPVAVQLYVMRFISSMLGMVTVLIAFLTARELFPDSGFMIISVPAFVIFLPMYTFLTGSVNSDNLAILLLSALFLQVILGLKKGFPQWRVWFILLLVTLGLVTKRTTVFAVPLVTLLIPIHLFGKRYRITLKWAYVGLAILVVSMVCILGILGSDRLRNTFEWILSNYYADSSFRGSMSALMQRDYFSLDFLALCWLYIESMFKGFWANFGWAYIKLAPVWYQVLALTSLIAAGGLVAFVYRAVRSSKPFAAWQIKGLLIFSLAISLVVLQTIARQVSFSLGCPLCRPQGRYLLPVIVPTASLFMLGLRGIVPPRYHTAALFSVVSALVALDLLCLIGYIVPFYYG